MTIIDTFQSAFQNIIKVVTRSLLLNILGWDSKILIHEATEASVSLNKQSQILPGPERIHVSILSEDESGNYEQPLYIYEDVRTMYDVVRKGLVHSNDGNCLGYRPDDASGYSWLSYSTVIKRSVNFGRGLRHLGVNEKEFVGIYSKNRVEWVLAEQGIHSFSMTSVPLYDTLGPDACNFIINQAEITTIVLENAKNLLAILERIPSCLRMIIYMDRLSSGAATLAKDSGLDLHQFTEVERLGEEMEDTYPEKPPKPDDIAALIYTSGTTGTPKGVMTTHTNFVSCLSGGIAFYQHFGFQISKDDIMISYLPLAHVYERIMEGILLVKGGSIGFFRGDPRKLLEDIQCLKPTVFPCVPRILNTLYDKIMGAANHSSLKRFLIQTALSSKAKEVEGGIFRRDSIWDYLVFRKVQNALGGRVRIVVSASAPINAEILKFFRCALGCWVLEGYGQTESSGVVALTLPIETVGGHVGPPAIGTALKLVDVPEMNYYAQNDQGELCVKGAMVFKGYYKNSEETQEALDKDGWLHTGDIATWIPNGALKIIDRKKNIFKLSQGEYVAPEKIEIIYSRCPSVSQIFVYGDSLQSFLVGIVVPDPEVLKEMYPSAEMSALCVDPNVKTLILDELERGGRDSGLNSFERVKNIYLHPEAFTLENGLLTPTMKSKRPELKAFFKSQIEEMYDNFRKK